MVGAVISVIAALPRSSAQTTFVFAGPTLRTTGTLTETAFTRNQIGNILSYRFKKRFRFRRTGPAAESRANRRLPEPPKRSSITMVAIKKYKMKSFMVRASLFAAVMPPALVSFRERTGLTMVAKETNFH
jgi:hypothetical protein